MRKNRKVLKWSEETMKPIYIPCSCHTPYHCLVIEEDPDLPDELTVSFVSTRPNSLWHRIRYAMKHIFQRQDLVFADIIIKRDDLLEQLRNEHEQEGF